MWGTVLIVIGSIVGVFVLPIVYLIAAPDRLLPRSWVEAEREAQAAEARRKLDRMLEGLDRDDRKWLEEHWYFSHSDKVVKALPVHPVLARQLETDDERKRRIAQQRYELEREAVKRRMQRSVPYR